MNPLAFLRRRQRQRPERGQALVEFAVVLIPFLVILMGIVDLGRGIYVMNGTAQAAREIARVTSVHTYNTCCDLGSSTQSQQVIAVQRGLIPGLAINPSTDIVCVDASDTVISDNMCRPGDYVRVYVSAPFAPITPLVSAFGTHTFRSYSRIQIP